MIAERRRERADRRRAGRRTLAKLRRQAWYVARRAWRGIAVFIALWFAATILIVRMQQTAFLRGFMMGLMLGLLGFFVMLFLVSSGIAQRQMGGAAEQWTAEVLAGLDRHRWRVVHDVAFDTINVDHVIVGPGRIYAVETKWTSWQGDPKFLQSAKAGAERAARKLRLLLASTALARHVVPLVVVWGPGTGQMDAQPDWSDGPGIVAGNHADVWLPLLQASATGDVRDLEAERAITDFITIREQHDANR